MNASERRFELLYLVSVYDTYRGGARRVRSGAENILREGFGRLGLAWTGTLDIAWFRAALTEVRAASGEYPAGSYERWRRAGLPAWAAHAAGLNPTAPEAVEEESEPSRLPVDPARQPAIDDLILGGRYGDAIAAAREAYALTMHQAVFGVLARKRELGV